MAHTIAERGREVNDTLAGVGSELIAGFEGRTEDITRSITETGNLAAETISTRVKEVNDALKSNSDSLLVDLALRGQEINDKLDETGTQIAETITIPSWQAVCISHACRWLTNPTTQRSSSF